MVTRLPSSTSWQDFKDRMREAGDVCFAEIFGNGKGSVEFLKHDGMKNAIKYLQNSQFISHEGDTTYIRVRGNFKRGGDSAKIRNTSRSQSADTYSISESETSK